MRFSRLLTTTSIIAAAATAVAILWNSDQPAQGQTRPGAPARYEMDVGTTSGMFGGMGAGANVNPLAMLTGRGQGQANHELYLRLGTQQAASPGAPQAEHFLPEAARMGRSVPLITPERPQPEGDAMPGDRPRGRLLIFWGCGEHAPAGQPVIIDFARLAAGQVPPNLFTSSVPRQREVSASNSRTYGEWPNGRSRVTVRPESSILGAHRIAGNYSPEIAFSLAQDFMGPVNARSTAAANGSVPVSWNSVAGATGYYLWAFGGRDMGARGRNDAGDLVWWSSSASQQFGGALWDWIDPATVANLIRQRVVLSPTTTSCTIPAEVRQAAPEFMLGNLYAYGPQANFAFPPRPENPRAAWNPIWTARVRYRSTTGWLVGGPDMGDAATGGGTAQNGQPPNPRCRRRGGIGGVLGGALGLPSGC